MYKHVTEVWCYDLSTIQHAMKRPEKLYLSADLPSARDSGANKATKLAPHRLPSLCQRPLLVLVTESHTVVLGLQEGVSQTGTDFGGLADIPAMLLSA